MSRKAYTWRIGVETELIDVFPMHLWIFVVSWWAWVHAHPTGLINERATTIAKIADQTAVATQDIE